ncbi:NAD-dependent epimerase/dehydratase family protein [Exiguobacterium acetylicum]|uniref:NAD-dependent epimerase/dehydratase family protein n=1 Tax=Exiguobacterium sp. BMC-KP TaxID=1684312 RepID=UPI0006AA2724|nr:NAD-dependent epimerase/dehydratase family protein [Exiguobacterium sp. BMC-KP]KOP29346.1 epimerase [Exiguobacterium sp. BMC-KP]
MNLNESTILITGMTGTLGSRVARRVLKEAREVRGLYRSKEQADQYAFNGVHAVIGELGHPASLLAALQGVDLLIHCAAYLGDDADLAQEANVTGVQHLADAATTARVKRIIHISTTSVYGEVVSGHFTETSPLLSSEHVYIHTKQASERLLQENTPDSDLIILRPGSICAEEQSYWGDRQVERMKEADMITWVHPDDVVPWVHTDNLVEMIVLAATNAHNGDIFNAIDANLPETDFRMKLITASGTAFKVPDRAAEHATFANDRIKQLGYIPIRTPESTVEQLVKSF